MHRVFTWNMIYGHHIAINPMHPKIYVAVIQKKRRQNNLIYVDVYRHSTYPSIKGTSRKTFFTTSIRSSRWIADAVCCVHIDMRFIIIVEKHKPHNLKNSVRFRRRIAFTVFAAVPRLFLIAIRVSICKDEGNEDF